MPGGVLAKRRLVVVVLNGVGNEYSSGTIIASLRDTHGGRRLPIHVPVPARVAGLTKDSMVDAGQLLTLHQDSLEGPVGRLPREILDAVDRALARSLGL